jgi:hypothetical protein
VGHLWLESGAYENWPGSAAGFLRFVPVFVSVMDMRRTFVMRVAAPLCAACRTAYAAAAAAYTARAFAMAAAFVMAAILGGCSTRSAPPPAPPPPPAAPPPGSPHVITDLSQLSSSDTALAPLASAEKALKGTPAAAPTPSMGAHGPGDQTPAALRRLFLNNPDASRYSDTPLPHTQERLLNAKAAQYSGFSSRMLSQLLKEMVKLEKQPPADTMILPDDVKPVIVTAVLNGKGQLRELIFEQHSGVATVDNLVIKACKESLWAGTAPEEALAEDGNYRLRIEAEVSNYSADREGKQEFITRLGLGIL